MVLLCSPLLFLLVYVLWIFHVPRSDVASWTEDFVFGICIFGKDSDVNLYAKVSDWVFDCSTTVTVLHSPKHFAAYTQLYVVFLNSYIVNCTPPWLHPSKSPNSLVVGEFPECVHWYGKLGSDTMKTELNRKFDKRNTGCLFTAIHSPPVEAVVGLLFFLFGRFFLSSCSKMNDS